MRLTILLTALSLLCFTHLPAQLPQVTVSDKATPLLLQKLAIDVKILGNRSSTTFTMTFHNTSNKVVEGTFNFPLPEGAAVTRYALDINGTMREGVPVEKDKATEVFETVEKRKVDPGLLEKSEGNMFRTRIYPFPAQGERSIIIAFEGELSFNGNQKLQYHLPLTSTDAIPQFSLNVQVQGEGSVPIIESSPVSELRFLQFGNQYCVH